MSEKQRRPWTAQDDTDVANLNRLVAHYGTKARTARSLGVPAGTLSVFCAGDRRITRRVVVEVDRQLEAIDG